MCYSYDVELLKNCADISKTTLFKSQVCSKIQIWALTEPWHNLQNLQIICWFVWICALCHYCVQRWNIFLLSCLTDLPAGFVPKCLAWPLVLFLNSLYLSRNGKKPKSRFSIIVLDLCLTHHNPPSLLSICLRNWRFV